MRKKNIFLLLLFLVLSSFPVFSDDNGLEGILRKISEKINHSGGRELSSLMPLLAIDAKDLNENEKEYLAFLKDSFKNGEIYKYNTGFLTDDKFKTGIIIKKTDEGTFFSFVFKKDLKLSENLKKAEAYFYEYLKNENFYGIKTDRKFLPLICAGEIINKDTKFYYLKNTDNWRKLIVLFDFKKCCKDNSNLYYEIAKVLASGVGPFFVKDDYFIITVKERFGEDFLFLENIKIKTMAVLFLRVLVKKKIAEDISDELLFEIFLENFEEGGKEKKFLSEYLKLKDSDLKTKDKVISIFKRLKKLLRDIIKVERDGDKEGFQDLLEGDKDEGSGDKT